MIRLFVTVGNSLDRFDRLLEMVDEALGSLPSPFEGVCQHGPSSVRPRRLMAKAFLPRAEFLAEMDRADIVITHAGVGSLSSAIRAGHRPLVVPRRAAFGEIINDHQLDIVDALTRAGKITNIRDAGGLSEELVRYARGHAVRGERRKENAAKLEPLAKAIGEGPARQTSMMGSWALLRVLALLAPPLHAMLVRRHDQGGAREGDQRQL